MPQRNITKSHARFLIAAAVTASAASSFGEGFRNPPAGAYSLGRAGARFAQNDDPSTAYHNPANIVEIEGTTLSIAPSAVYISIERNGGTEETTDGLKLLPNFFATHKFNDKLSLGLAIVAPYGLSNEWDQKKGGFADMSAPGTLRYQAPWYTEMKTVDVNPSVSYRILDNLSVGAGLNVHWSELTFKRYFPWQFFGGTEGAMKARGDGFGFGANAGITWEIVEGHRLAATYRSPIEVDYDGYLKIENFTANPFGGAPRSHFGTRIETPTIVGLGYGVQLTEAIQLEANFEWLEFSNFETLSLDTGANNILLNSGASTAPIVQPQNWDDTFTVGIGGSWQMCSEWRLNASYQYYESPVPNAFFTTTIPDGDQNVFTVGLQWKRGKHAFEFAYGGIFYDERNISNVVNPVYNGRYDITVHLFALSYNFAF